MSDPSSLYANISVGFRSAGLIAEMDELSNDTTFAYVGAFPLIRKTGSVGHLWGSAYMDGLLSKHSAPLLLVLSSLPSFAHTHSDCLCFLPPSSAKMASYVYATASAKKKPLKHTSCPFMYVKGTAETLNWTRDSFVRYTTMCDTLPPLLWLCGARSGV